MNFPFCYCSVAKSPPALWESLDWAHQAPLSSTVCWSLLRSMSTESVMPSNHLILCCPLRLLPSIFLSIRVFSNESALRIRWPKCWSFSFSIRPFNEYSGLIFFKIDRFDLLVVQGTLKSLLWHHNLKATALQYSFTIIKHCSVFLVIFKVTSNVVFSVLNLPDTNKFALAF